MWEASRQEVTKIQQRCNKDTVFILHFWRVFNKQLWKQLRCVRLCVRPYSFGTLWTDFHKIWHGGVLAQSVATFQPWAQSDESDGHLAHCWVYPDVTVLISVGANNNVEHYMFDRYFAWETTLKKCTFANLLPLACHQTGICWTSTPSGWRPQDCLAVPTLYTTIEHVSCILINWTQ
jgi:hypothetical protein